MHTLSSASRGPGLRRDDGRGTGVRRVALQRFKLVVKLARLPHPEASHGIGPPIEHNRRALADVRAIRRRAHDNVDATCFLVANTLNTRGHRTAFPKRRLAERPPCFSALDLAKSPEAFQGKRLFFLEARWFFAEGECRCP